jgi:methyl-accepting chemotaxis protein
MPWFANMPINRKLTTVILSTCTCMLLLAGAAMIVMDVVTSRKAMVENMTVLADLLGRYTIAPLTFHREEDAEEAKQTLSAIQADPHILVACLYDKGHNRFGDYARAGAVRNFPVQPPPDGYRFTRDYLELSSPVELDQKRIGTIYLRADLGRVYSQFRLHAEIIGAVLLVTIVMTFALSPRLRKPIAEPILALADVARGVAEKKDYSVRAAKRGEDEVGLLTDAFNQMLGEIGTGQSSLQKVNQSLREQTREIVESINVLVSSSSEIFATSTQLASGAAETATAVNETTNTVEKVRQTAHLASVKARSVSENAQKMSQISQNGTKSTEEVIEGINHIHEQMGSIGDMMGRLSEQSLAIGQIVATVEGLASQTNLLAVNAAIEAAKAGEHGRGFAVVAHEMKNLAEQSHQATNQVRNILTDIRNATSAAVMATEQGGKVVEVGVVRSSQAAQSIQILSNSVTEAAQTAVQIVTSSQQQLVGLDQMALAMENIKEASGQNLASAKQLNTAAQSLQELGRKLKQTVDRCGM